MSFGKYARFSVFKFLPQRMYYYISSHFILIVETHTRLPGSPPKRIRWVDLSTVVDMEISTGGFLFPRSILTFTSALITPGAIRQAVMSGGKMDTAGRQAKTSMLLSRDDAAELYECFEQQMRENKEFFKSQNEAVRNLALRGTGMGTGVNAALAPMVAPMAAGGGASGSNAQLADILNRFSQELAQFAAQL